MPHIYGLSYPSENRTLTQTATYCLLIFNTKEIRFVETEATSSRIQSQGGVRSAERRRNTQPVGQSVWGSTDYALSMEARDA